MALINFAFLASNLPPTRNPLRNGTSQTNGIYKGLATENLSQFKLYLNLSRVFQGLQIVRSRFCPIFEFAKYE